MCCIRNYGAGAAQTHNDEDEDSESEDEERPRTPPAAAIDSVSFQEPRSPGAIGTTCDSSHCSEQYTVNPIPSRDVAKNRRLHPVDAKLPI